MSKIFPGCRWSKSWKGPEHCRPSPSAYCRWFCSFRRSSFSWSATPRKPFRSCAQLLLCFIKSSTQALISISKFEFGRHSIDVRQRFGVQNDGIEARAKALRSIVMPNAAQGRRPSTQTEETGSLSSLALLCVIVKRLAEINLCALLLRLCCVPSMLACVGFHRDVSSLSLSLSAVCLSRSPSGLCLAALLSQNF